jgi:hypothetical protein
LAKSKNKKWLNREKEKRNLNVTQKEEKTRKNSDWCFPTLTWKVEESRVIIQGYLIDVWRERKVPPSKES